MKGDSEGREQNYTCASSVATLMEATGDGLEAEVRRVALVLIGHVQTAR